jgi:hypothetical protein
METLNDIKTDVCDMLVYCDVISSKDSSTQSKIAFTHLMGKGAKRIAEKCDKLEKDHDRVDRASKILEEKHDIFNQNVYTINRGVKCGLMNK